MTTQCSSGLTDLAFLLRSTRNPSVWAGRPAVLHRDRDSRDGVPHCPRRCATLSTLEFPLASFSDEGNNLTGADTSHPSAGAVNNHSYWIDSGGCFSLHNSLTRLLTPKCPEKRETEHVWGFYPFRNSGFPDDIPTALLLCNPLLSGSSRVALLKYSSSSVQVLATLLGGIHFKVICCSGPNDLVRMISVGAVWNWLVAACHYHAVSDVYGYWDECWQIRVYFQLYVCVMVYLNQQKS